MKKSISLLVGFLFLSIFVTFTHAVTKIAPTEAEAGHPFTVIDTAGRRLVDGALAVFRLAGLEVTRPLRTHKPYNTAQGRLAPDMYGGLYAVSVRQPDGTEFAIGEFTVLGPTAPPPWIEPDLGAVGDGFTVTDPLARVQTGDLALFYAAGADPSAGAPAANVIVGNGGMTLTGNVPAGAAQGVQNFVTVRPTATGDARFGDLAFFVTGGVRPPFIVPDRGPRDTVFTVTDDLGRMEQGDVALFYLDATPQYLGASATEVQVTPDGKQLTGKVPYTPETGIQHHVTVREHRDADSRFGDLPFFVEPLR